MISRVYPEIRIPSRVACDTTQENRMAKAPAHSREVPDEFWMRMEPPVSQPMRNPGKQHKRATGAGRPGKAGICGHPAYATHRLPMGGLSSRAPWQRQRDPSKIHAAAQGRTPQIPVARKPTARGGVLQREGLDARWWRPATGDPTVFAIFGALQRSIACTSFLTMIFTQTREAAHALVLAKSKNERPTD